MRFRNGQGIPFLLALLSFSAFGAEPVRDFLVIGTPSACALYDQYEQLLSDVQKKALPANAPFEIINGRQLMGDQITQAMRLGLLGSVYYLMLDEKGNMAGVPQTAAAVRYKRCSPRYDTLVVTVPSLTLTQRPSAGGALGTLHKGETVLRIFTWRGSSYLLGSGSRPVFGWAGASGNILRPVAARHPAGVSGDAFAQLHLRIMKRLKDANGQYDTLFSYFNSRTRQEKTAPQWIAETTEGYHRYILQGSDEIIRSLESSTLQIVKEVEQLLLGKPYLASYRHGVITIGPR